MEESSVENSQSTDINSSRISKCPKPFTIESIISSANSSKNVDIDSEDIVNSDKTTNCNIASALYFPSNVSMAAAASIYNPWFHSYFMQQQKINENVIDMMQFGSVNPTNIKENHISTIPFDQQEQNLPPTSMRSNEMIATTDTDYYKHLSNYGNILTQYSDRLEQCKNQLKTSDENNIHLSDTNTKYTNGIVGEYNISVRNDDSGPEENNEYDLDSDCNSEISMNMSPDDENTTQGICNFLIDTFCLLFHSTIVD